MIDQFDQIFKDCKQKVDNKIKDYKDFKLSDVELIVNENFINTTIKPKNIDYLKRQIVNSIVEEHINKIYEQCKTNLDRITGIYKFSENLEKWYVDKYQGKEDMPSSNAYSDLATNLPQLNQTQSDMFTSINSFLFHLSLIQQLYLDKLFKDQELYDEFYFMYKELNSGLNDLIVLSFKTKFPKSHEQCQNFLTDLKNSMMKKLAGEINTFFSNSSIASASPFERYESYRKTISQQFQDQFKSKFAIQGKIYRFLFKFQIKSTYEESDRLFNLLHRSSKNKNVRDANGTFKQFMLNIKIDDILNVYKNPDEIVKQEYLLAFFIQNTDVHVEADKKFLVSLIKQFKIVDNTLQMVVKSIENMPFSSFYQVLSLFKGSFDKWNESFFEAMRKVQLDDPLIFYKYLTVIYLMSSNVIVDFERNEITFNQFLGKFYAFRIQLLHILKDRLGFSQVTYFFNFLDLYIESNWVQPVLQLQNPNAAFKSVAIKTNYGVQNYKTLLQLRKEIRDKPYFDNVEALFQQQLKDIKSQNNLKHSPKFLHLVQASYPGIRSRNIVIAVSGFTSEGENKKVKWADLADIFPSSEIYGMHYRSQSMTDMVKFGAKSLAKGALCLAFGGLIGLGLGIKHMCKENPFTEAWREADIVGEYLAYLIHNQMLFPDSSISVVGFSLGTQVINSFLLHYKTLLEKSQKPSQLAAVCMFGGVADIQFIKKNNLTSSIGYRLFNCHCNKDKILRVLLRVVKNRSDPAGLSEIKEDSNKIENHNFSHRISGHANFFENHAFVLQQIDFRQETLGTIKQQNLKSFLSFTNTELQYFS